MTVRSRRYQTLPPRAHCGDCGWQDTATGVAAAAEAEACAHADDRGHDTALVITSQIRISPAAVPAMAASAPEEAGNG